MSWATVGKWALKIGIYALGHQGVIESTVADAKSKNIKGLAGDAGVIVADVVPPPQ